MTTTKGDRTREAIRAAAAELFVTRGYAGTSVRDIAARAAVDPALVVRYWGSKEKLFLQTMHLDHESMLDLDAPLTVLGERLVRFVLGADAEVRSIYLALVRASETVEVAAALRLLHEEGFVTPLEQRLEGADVELRARLIASMVGGLMYSLWVAGDERLARESVDGVLRAYVPALQALITP